ncbi:SDR family oxidoreductase [Leifsonia sp. L25]|uniref:SDR family oxidoreductase n=1 Tax=Actinomycetes TaxID=1760 RepID=UPI003D68C3EB
MIVVAGGSGLLGRHVVAELVGKGVKVRVLTRDTARARALFDDRVEVVSGDVRRRDGLDEAVADAEMVVSAVHGFLGGRGAGPAEVDDRGNAHLVEAAAAADAGVVLVSASGASPDHPIDLFRAKFAAEEYLRESEAPWVIVRPPAYLETWLGILSTTAGASGRPLVFGRGVQPIPFVSVLDVAAVVTRAATDPTVRGRVIEVAGEPITMNDLARALQDARGWRGPARHVPRPLLRLLSVAAAPLSPAFARQNRTALAMDTGVPRPEAPVVGPIDGPRRTLGDVLAGSSVA